MTRMQSHVEPVRHQKAGSILSWINNNLLAILFILPALILVGGLMYYPMISAFVESLYETSFLSPQPKFIGLDNYQEMIGDKGFWQIVRNSLMWTIFVVVCQNILGMATAILLNQNIPGRGLMRAIVLLPWVLPGIVAAILWRFMYDPQLGLVNSILLSLNLTDTGIPWLAQSSTAMMAVVIAAIWKGFPFSTVIYLAALQGVSSEQMEAGQIDGANGWQRFIHIVIPSMSHIIRLNLLLTTIFTFNYFDMIWITTKGGPLNSTHIFPTIIFQLGFGEFQFGKAAAYGVVAVLLLAIFAFLYIREVRPGSEGV